MSKIVMSLPEGMVKNVCVGAVASLVTYVLFQFAVAFLIGKEVVGEEMMYPAVCVSAGMSSFVGCRIQRGVSLSAMAVSAVFLVLTVVIGFLSGAELDADMIVGIGAAMSVGGLTAAALGGTGDRKGKGREKRKLRYK